MAATPVGPSRSDVKNCSRQFLVARQLINSLLAIFISQSALYVGDY